MAELCSLCSMCTSESMARDVSTHQESDTTLQNDYLEWGVRTLHLRKMSH